MQKFSFKELLQEYIVEIPMIQRDYAYGRKNEAEKRENFLQCLRSFLDKDIPHELDFIYGSLKEGKLILLDGQQRITTLFLLHWYLSLIKNETGTNNFDDFRRFILSSAAESRFTYKTRFSSTDFCNKIAALLVDGYSGKESAISGDISQKYSDLIADPTIELSEEIKNEKWFLPNWKYDPTILSMLTMLDSIKSVFPANACADYYQKLTEQKVIVFNFLNLDEFHLSDELYIKMNSRGRPLTRFENLKSKILMLYDEAEKKAPEKYSEKLRELRAVSSTGDSIKSIRDYVSHAFDTKWTDMFWREWRNSRAEDTQDDTAVDNMMLSFLAVTVIYDHILHILLEMNGKLSLARTSPAIEEIDRLMRAKKVDEGITIKYDKFIELFRENEYESLFKMIDYLNAFCENGELKTYLPPEFSLYEVREAFLTIADDYRAKESDRKFADKVKFFAFLKYVSENPCCDVEHLKAWMRFVCNVCANSYNLENRTETFCNSIAGINYLYDKDIANALLKKDISRVVTLDLSQIEEERLKMLLSKDESWKTTLMQAEKELCYFEGRLRYPLIDCCAVTEDDIHNEIKRMAFEEYVKKIAAIFPNKEGCPFEGALIRAMLAKGNYCLKYRQNDSLLRNLGRDNSWRRFLHDASSPCECGKDNRGVLFRSLLDDPLFDSSQAEISLNEIARNRNEAIPAWRKRIIDHPEIFRNTSEKSDLSFARSSDRCLRWNESSYQEYSHDKRSEDNYEIDLLRGTSIHGYHAELFSFFKYCDLVKENPSWREEWELKYQETRTETQQPYFYLTKGERTIKVYYRDDDCFGIIGPDIEKSRDKIQYDELEEELESIINTF